MCTPKEGRHRSVFRGYINLQNSKQRRSANWDGTRLPKVMVWVTIALRRKVGACLKSLRESGREKGIHVNGAKGLRLMGRKGGGEKKGRKMVKGV